MLNFLRKNRAEDSLIEHRKQLNDDESVAEELLSSVFLQQSDLIGILIAYSPNEIRAEWLTAQLRKLKNDQLITREVRDTLRTRQDKQLTLEKKAIELATRNSIKKRVVPLLLLAMFGLVIAFVQTLAGA